MCAGSAREFYSLAIAEKSVVLYGGEGSTTVFRSSNSGGFCCTDCVEEGSANTPVAAVEAVAPIVLSSRVLCCENNGNACCSCECKPSCACEVTETIPAPIGELFDGCLALSGEDGGNRLVVSLGIFSVVRLERAAQLLVNAQAFSVPDKECVSASSDENPCCLFRSMAFPTNAFGGTGCCTDGRKSH